VREATHVFTHALNPFGALHRFGDQLLEVADLREDGLGWPLSGCARGHPAHALDQRVLGLRQSAGEIRDHEQVTEQLPQRTHRLGGLSGFRFVDIEAEQVEQLWGIVFSRARELASFLCCRSDLEGIPFDDAVDLAMHTRLVRFSAGDWIFRQGSMDATCDSAYVLLEGSASLEAINEGSESIYLDRLESGAFFGGLPMLVSEPHAETAMAETSCELLEIDLFSYQYLLTDRPDAAYAITRTLMGRYARRLTSLTAGAPARPRNPVHRFVGAQTCANGEIDLRHGGLGVDD
jgi:CRP-like cAMP-binding protein